MSWMVFFVIGSQEVVDVHKGLCLKMFDCIGGRVIIEKSLSSYISVGSGVFRISQRGPSNPPSLSLLPSPSLLPSLPLLPSRPVPSPSLPLPLEVGPLKSS